MNSCSIPDGFLEIRLAKSIWWIKEGYEQMLPGALKADQDNIQLLTAPSTLGGRGVMQRIQLEKDEHALVRWYRRGGFVRHFTRDLYWDHPFRPFAELVCTETARQRRVPTIEVLAAGVELQIGGLYRGVFISREATEFSNLWEWFRRRPSQAERLSVLKAVTQTLSLMYEAGIEHADLNLTNILVRSTADGACALIIDFDRARVFAKALTLPQRQRILQRLRRSLLKLDPTRQFHSSEEEDLLCQIKGREQL